MRRDGASWRRVVASPEPRELVELPLIQFAEATGRPAAIGRLNSAADVLAGTAGTLVEP